MQVSPYFNNDDIQSACNELPQTSFCELFSRNIVSLKLR